ncbi:hypothetical protein Btru_001277 [Bulinus truncatus]|nr:hypothetical protein Btru_001277 [Bulinus truncatus]
MCVRRQTPPDFTGSLARVACHCSKQHRHSRSIFGADFTIVRVLGGGWSTLEVICLKPLIRTTDMIMLTNNNKRPSVVRKLFGSDSDDKETSLHLARQEQELYEDDSRRFIEKWGFDPVNERFISGGKYECVPILSDEYIPSFYTKVYSHKTDNSRRACRNLSRHVSAKRKLNLGENDIINDENRITVEDISTRVPCKGEVVEDVSTSRVSDAITTDSVNERLCPSQFTSFGLSGCSNEETLEISKKNEKTPQERHFNQSHITDYLPSKKRRLTCQKTSQNRT